MTQETISEWEALSVKQRGGTVTTNDFQDSEMFEDTLSQISNPIFPLDDKVRKFGKIKRVIIEGD